MCAGEAGGVRGAEVGRDEARLVALGASVDGPGVRRDVAGSVGMGEGAPGSGAIGQWPVRARFHGLTARRSAIVQTSPVHTGRCTDGASALQHIMRRMVWPPEPRNLAK